MGFFREASLAEIGVVAHGAAVPYPAHRRLTRKAHNPVLPVGQLGVIRPDL